jgi:hypothetical protein
MKRLIYLLSIVLVATMFSCEEDDSNIIPDNGNSKRIKEIIKENDIYVDDLLKTVFTYQDDKLVLMMEYKWGTNDWYEFSKTEFSYIGNEATEINQYYEVADGQWRTSTKRIYTIENGLITNVLSYSYDKNNWVEDQQYIFEYSNSKLIGSKIYEFGTQYAAEEFIYQNNNIHKILSYGLNENQTRELGSEGIFTYENNKILNFEETYFDFDNVWKNQNKEVYSYIDERISKITWFYWSSYSDNWEEDYSYDYFYDSDGLLTEQRKDVYGATRYTYTYEDGEGNAKLFYYDYEDLEEVLVSQHPTFE